MSRRRLSGGTLLASVIAVAAAASLIARACEDESRYTVCDPYPAACERGLEEPVREWQLTRPYGFGQVTLTCREFAYGANFPAATGPRVSFCVDGVKGTEDLCVVGDAVLETSGDLFEDDAPLGCHVAREAVIFPADE